jgi:hypothetical protein
VTGVVRVSTPNKIVTSRPESFQILNVLASRNSPTRNLPIDANIFQYIKKKKKKKEEKNHFHFACASP